MGISTKELLGLAIERRIKTDAEMGELIELFMAKGKLSEAEKNELMGMFETPIETIPVMLPPSLEDRVIAVEEILMMILI